MHPCTHIERHGDTFVVTCKDKFESFSKGREPKFAIPYADLLGSLESLREELRRFSKGVDEVGLGYGMSSLSRTLVTVSFST